jgi:hypothetical protein
MVSTPGATAIQVLVTRTLMTVSIRFGGHDARRLE